MNRDPSDGKLDPSTRDTPEKPAAHDTVGKPVEATPLTESERSQSDAAFPSWWLRRAQQLMEEAGGWMAMEERLHLAESAKESYLELTGRTNEEDSTFERRMAVYLEYLLLEWKTPPPEDRTPLELFADACSGELAKEDHCLLATLSASHMSLFELLKKRDEEVLLGDLIYGGRWKVQPEGAMLGVEEGDVFQARLLELRGEVFFTQAFLHHPTEARHLAKKAIQELREKEVDPLSIMGRLAKMHLKFDRYRRMNLLQIYGA
jgi:hypothetical protein